MPFSNVKMHNKKKLSFTSKHSCNAKAFRLIIESSLKTLVWVV